MPDGFDPHVELAKIYTLQELMVSCRQRLPTILNVLDDALMHPDIYVRLQAVNMCMDRGFGKPRQHVEMSHNDTVATKRVQIVMPDNGRGDMIEGPVIDAQVQ